VKEKPAPAAAVPSRYPAVAAESVQIAKTAPKNAASDQKPESAANLAPPQPPVLAKGQNPVEAHKSAGPASVPARKPENTEASKAGSGRGPGLRQAPITAEDLLETSVEVQNGNGVPDLAREIRSLLHLEGFDEVAITNHIDFGVERTEIRYRQESEKVARMLHDKFFARAQMKADAQLGEDTDVLVILGKDAPNLGQIMAQKPGDEKPL
jgi:hypothetical protein